ncbi:MAG: NAD(P)-dependent oxidoreductase [Candidatus Berkelbacteria bacterium]
MKIVFFEATLEEQKYFGEKLPNDDLVFSEEVLDENTEQNLNEIEIVSVFIYSKVSAKVLKKMPNLKLIITRSTGFDHIDLAYAKENQITVTNVPAYGENTVAEHTFALILALSRKIVASSEHVRHNGDFSLEGLRGFDLEGKTIGIIGTGKIGSKVAKMAASFDMKIVAYDQFKNEDLIRKYKVEYLPLKDVLAKSDVVSLNLRHTAETHHLINAETIEYIKPGTVLVNTARGGLIDTPVLLPALDSGKLAGIGLDVLEEEGSVKEDIQLTSRQFTRRSLMVGLANALLVHKPNVIITPHNAFNSVEAFKRIMDTTIENIVSFEKGEPINTVLAE